MELSRNSPQNDFSGASSRLDLVTGLSRSEHKGSEAETVRMRRCKIGGLFRSKTNFSSFA